MCHLFLFSWFTGWAILVHAQTSWGGAVIVFIMVPCRDPYIICRHVVCDICKKIHVIPWKFLPWVLCFWYDLTGETSSYSLLLLNLGCCLSSSCLSWHNHPGHLSLGRWWGGGDRGRWQLQLLPLVYHIFHRCLGQWCSVKEKMNRLYMP